MTQQWYDNPVEFQPTELMLQRYWDEERQKQRQNYFDLPIRGEWNRDIAASGALWFDINNNQQAYRGLLDHSVATDDSMAEDYTQGYLADNSNHVRYVARNIQSLYGGTDYSGTTLDIDPDTERIIQEGVALSGWNAPDQLSGGMIGLDITDLLNMDAPDGWSPEEALDIFEERDPRRYGNYITLFRDKRQLLSIVEEAKNPIDFFYRLSNAAHKIQISQSIQHYNENTAVIPWVANWTKTLIVNGIINDPDLASSTGISLALGILTGGSTLVGTAAWTGFRSIKLARRAFKFTRWTRNAQNYLPETIGPHLLRKFVWKNTYKDAGFWGRSWRNIPGNIGEGLITGFAAEMSNQHRRVHLRYQKEFDMTRVGWETVFEGALSPAINPVIGRVYTGIGLSGQGIGFGVNWAAPHWLGGQGGLGGGRSREGYGAFVTFAKKTLKKSAKFANPNYAEAWLTHMEILEELSGDLDTLLGNEQGITTFGEPDPATGLLEHPVLMLETLFDEYGVPPQRRMEILKRSLQRLKVVMGEKTYGSPTDLMLAVADDLGSNEQSIAKYATSPEGRLAINRVKSHVYLISQLANHAAEEGITLVEAHERLLKDENYYEVLVDDETKAKVEEAIQGEDLNDAQKWKKAQEILAEEQNQNEASIQEDLSGGRQLAEDINDAVDPTGETTVVSVPPQNQSAGETITALVKAEEQGRSYLEEHEKTHGENQESVKQSTAEREAAVEQQAVDPSKENEQAVENAQNKEDQAKETLSKSENTLETLRKALDSISQLLSDLDARIHNLTKAELKSLKELSADVRGLEAKQLKHRLVFQKRLNEYLDDLYELNKHIDRLESFAKKGGISRESLTEEEQKKVTISIAILIKQAEKTKNKKLLKAAHKLKDSKKLHTSLTGPLRDGIGAHLDKIFTSIKKSDSHIAHAKLNERIKEKLGEIALINNLSLARVSRLSSRRFDRIASAKGVARHQKHIKNTHKKRRGEFEGEARLRGEDGRFTRQELFEAVGPEGMGAWISPLSQARRNYFNTKNKLQGKARSEFLKHEFTVKEARQELNDAIEEVEARLITEKPGSIIGEAIRSRKKAGAEASTIAEEYIPVADVTADDRTAQSSPGTHSVIGTPIVSGRRVKGYVHLDPAGLESTGKDIIITFQADLSTAVHELGHIVRTRILKGNDLATIETHLGVENKRWTTENEERFAELFEQYFVEDKAPENASEELRSVFKKIATVLGKIYRTLRGKESINSEVKEVFDRLIQKNNVTGSYNVNSQYAQTIAAATGMTEGEIGAVLGLMEALGLQQSNVTWKKATQGDVEFLYKSLALQEEGEAVVSTFLQQEDTLDTETEMLPHQRTGIGATLDKITEAREKAGIEIDTEEYLNNHWVSKLEDWEQTALLEEWYERMAEQELGERGELGEDWIPSWIEGVDIQEQIRIQDIDNYFQLKMLMSELEFAERMLENLEEAEAELAEKVPPKPPEVFTPAVFKRTLSDVLRKLRLGTYKKRHEVIFEAMATVVGGREVLQQLIDNEKLLIISTTETTEEGLTPLRQKKGIERALFAPWRFRLEGGTVPGVEIGIDAKLKLKAYAVIAAHEGYHFIWDTKHRSKRALLRKIWAEKLLDKFSQTEVGKGLLKKYSDHFDSAVEQGRTINLPIIGYEIRLDEPATQSGERRGRLRLEYSRQEAALINKEVYLYHAKRQYLLLIIDLLNEAHSDKKALRDIQEKTGRPLTWKEAKKTFSIEPRKERFIYNFTMIRELSTTVFGEDLLLDSPEKVRDALEMGSYVRTLGHSRVMALIYIRRMEIIKRSGTKIPKKDWADYVVLKKMFVESPESILNFSTPKVMMQSMEIQGLRIEPFTPEIIAFMGETKEKGYFYHGTTARPEDLSDIFNTSTGAGLHITTNPFVAGSFTGGEYGRVYPLYARAENPLRIRDIDNFKSPAGLAAAIEDALGSETITKEEFTEKVRKEWGKRIHEAQPRDPNVSLSSKRKRELRTEVIQDILKSYGYDSLVYLNRGEIRDRRTGKEPENLRLKMLKLSAMERIKLMESQTDDDFSEGRDTRYLSTITDEEFLSEIPEATDSYVIFKPSHVKSAIANNGDFDLNKSSILMQTADLETQHLIDEATAWASWVEGLRAVSINAKKFKEIGGKRYTESYRIWATMPGFFRDVRKGPHITFKPALLDQEEQGTSFPDVINHRGEEFNYYDIDKVVMIAEHEHTRAVGRLQGWHRVARQELLEALSNDIIGSGEKTGDAVNDMVALEFITRVEKAFRPLYIEAKGRYGFISHLEEETGEPVFLTNKHDVQAFTEIVRRAIKSRLDEYITSESGNKDLNKLEPILDALGYRANLDQTADLRERVSLSIDNATSLIMKHIGKLTPAGEHTEWSIEAFGDGVIDWAPAVEIGAGLVDLLTGSPLAVQRGIESNVLHNEDIRKEEHDPGGESIRLRQTRRGESNRSAPISLHHLASVVNQYRFMKRINYLLQHDEFTPEQREAVEAWIEKVNSEGTPNPLGFGAGFRVNPYTMGGFLDQAIPSKETLTEWALTFLLDLPNLAHSVIHDQISVSQNNPLRFRGDLKNFSEDFSHGDDIILPFHWWGEVLSYEQMSPTLEGLSEGLLDHEAARYKEWREANPDLSITDLFSPQTHVDRTGSGRWEMKALSLAADPGAIDALVNELKDTHGTKTIAKEIKEDGLFNTILKHRGFTEKDLSDHYLGLALEVAQLITSHPNHEIVKALGPMLTAFGQLDGITTVEELIERSETNDIIKTLRKVFKVPAMRFIYEGTMRNFKKEFILANKGKAKEAILELGELLGYDFYGKNHEELEALATILYKIGVNNMSIALQEASLGTRKKPSQVSLVERGTGISHAMRTAVMKYLSLNRSTDANITAIPELAEGWKAIIKAKSLEDPKSGKGVEAIVVSEETGAEHRVPLDITEISDKPQEADKKNSLIKADEALKLLEAALKKAAIYDFGEDVDFEEAMEKTRERYTNWDKIQAYLKERRNRVLTVAELNELKAMTYPNTPQTDMAVFRGLNMLGAATHQINLERAQLLAEAMGIAGFDAETQLAHMMNTNLYFPVGFSTMSDRGYQALQSMSTLTGIALDRAAVRPLRIRDNTTGKMVAFPYKSFEEFIKAKQEAFEATGGVWDQAKLRETFKEFLRDVENAEESLGLYDLVDNPFHKLSREDAKKKVEDLITLQQFIWWSSYEAPPASVFPDYTTEVSDEALLQELQEDWTRHSERMYKELPREMEIEVNDASDQELKLKGKAALIRSNEASKKTGYPIQLYHRSEVDDSRYIESSKPKGFMSTQPLYHSLPFHDRGILAFQRRVLQNKVDRLLGPVMGLREAIAPVPGVDNSLGWASPWSEKTLPASRTSLAEYLQLYGKNEEGMLAGTIARDLDTWASRRGLLNELHDKPEFYPYYFLVREIEKTYQKFVKYARSEMSEDELIYRRSEWLTALHKIDEVSRNIVEYEHSGLTLESKASLLALVRPIHDKATWKEILTSTVTEDHAEGKLLSPTLIHTELKAPLMPSEGIPIFKTAEDKAYWDEHIGEAHWKDIVNELTIGSGIIQAHDFNRFLMVPLYQSYISEVLKTYKRPDGTKPYADSDVHKDPRKWEEVVERQDRKEIIRRAKNIARGSKGVSIILDISVVEYADENNPDGPNLVKLMVESAVGQTVQKGKTKTEVSFNSRHASAEVGFGFLTRSPKIYKLIGGKFKIHLTPEGALKLFGITDNVRPLDNLQNAALSNKIFGIKFDQNNEPLRAKPLQDIIRDAIGFTTRHQIEEATRISDALNLIVRQSRADKSQGPRMISHKQVTIDQFGLDVVDLHAYKTGEIAPPEGRTLVWREAVLSPITEFLHSIEEENLFNPYFDIHAELTSLIKRVREDVGPSYQHALGISIALSSLMINGSHRVPADSMIIPFLDPQIYNTRRIADSGKVDIDPLINEAQALYRKIVIFQDSDSFIKTLPVYHAARTFAFEMSLDPAADMETSTEELFINWLKKKGLDEFDLTQPAKDSFLEFEAGRDKDIKHYYSYNQHLENYKPGLSDEEKRRQLILLSLDAAISHQETANDLRVEFDQTNLDSEESELDTLKSVFLGNVSKDHDTALKFAETRDNITRPHLRRVLKKIQSMEERGIVKGKGTRLLRQLILNAYAMNPLIVRDLMFDLEDHSIESGKTEEGKYYIRFGERLKEIGKDPLDIVQIFAHEVSHIARAKFISSNSGEWDAFQALLRGRGKGLVKKLVMAWHGNRWNSSAQEEYNNYVTKGPEEFIAALGQFFLLKDMLPTIKNMTTAEAKALQDALGFVGRIMSFVRNVFSGLDHVWSRFFVSNDDVNILMNRLFGLDITTPNYSQVLDVENTGPLTFNWMNRFTDDDWQLSQGQRGTMEEIDARFEDAVDHRNILEMMQEKGTITDEQLRKLNSLRNMTDRRLESGISIFEFYDRLPHTMAKFGTDVSMGDHTWQVLDLEAVLDSSLGNSTEIQIDRIVAFQYGLNQMRHKFGNQIQDNAGEFAMRMSKALGKLGRFMGLGKNSTVDENTIRSLVLSGIGGHTGNEYTWAAPHIIPIWLTTLIDEHITNTRGHYDTLEGLPSLRKSLEEVVNVENVLFKLHGVLQNEILSPLASFIKGDNTPGKKTREVLKEVSTAFALLVEDETEADLGFSEETKIRLDNLSPKKRELFYSTIKEMAQVMRGLMQNIQKSRQDLGDWTSAADSLMGYKLSQDIKQGTNSSTMFDAMNEEIHNRLLDNTHDFMDPLTLFAMNALPRFDTSENLTEDLFGPKGLYGNKTEPSPLYVLLVSQVAKTMDETFSSEEKVLNASLDPIKQTRVDDFVRKFRTLFEDGVLKEKYLSGFRITMQKLMRDMASGEITWSDFSIPHVDKLKHQYHHYLKESGGKDATHDMKVDRRLQSLFLNRDSLSFLEQSRGAIAFEMPQGRTPLLEARSLTTGKIYNVTQLHTRNFMNRSYMGHYLPNDAWWIPKVSQAIRNPIIRNNLTLHPVETVRSLKKGLADTTHERMILQYHLGMRGDIGHFLALFKYFNQVGDLHDMAGNKASPRVKKAMTKSVEFLEQKYAFLRGFQEEGASYGTMADWAFEMAPSVTKIAFAGNLGIASLTVEHMMNTFVTMIGEKKLLDGFRTMFSPIFHGLSSEETKLVASDIADAIEGMTQGFLPEYEQAANEAEAVFGQDFTNKWASQMLRFPKHVLRASATARIITLRKGIYSLLHSNPTKIKNMIKHIEDNPLKEPGDLEKAARKSKISWWSYGKILTYLQRAGLLHPGRTENLAVVLELGNVKDKFYTIGKVVSQLSARFDGKSDSYRNYMSVLSALRHVERQYLNEVVVSPNAFDIYTGNDRRSRAAEIFRRFPVLWASQMMIRRSNNMPLIAYGTFMLSMLTLDMVYMMSLRLAAGTSYEDLMKEIEDKGIGTFMLSYGARLPLWGRYYGWIAAAAVALSRDNKIEGGFVPAAAMAQLLQNLYKLGASPWTDDYTQQDLINAARILPMIGDTLVRLGVYSAWGDQISKKNRRGRGYGSPSAQHQYTYTHMGVPPEFDSMAYEAVTGEWFNEMGLEPDFPAYERQFKTLPGTRSNWEQMEQETHIDPEKAARREMPSRPSGIPRGPEAGSQRPPVDPIEAIKEKQILEIPEEFG